MKGMWGISRRAQSGSSGRSSNAEVRSGVTAMILMPLVYCWSVSANRSFSKWTPKAQPAESRAAAAVA